MFHKFLRLSRPNASIGSFSDVMMFKRCKGHSKWQNIRHQKEANDSARSILFTKYTKLIINAVNEGGGPNPNLNTKLFNIIEIARKSNMPMTTINNSIKSASGKKGEEQSAMLHIRGPSRCAFLVDIFVTHPIKFKHSLTSMLKRHMCKFDDSALVEFSKKGIILSQLSDAGEEAFDKALEDAISVGLEEVFRVEENSAKIQFECAPEKVFKAKTMLEKLGYTIESAVVEYLPITSVELNDGEIELCTLLLKKLEDMPEVIRVIDNIS